MKKNILLLFGGGGTEHEISEVSSKYLEENLIQIAEYNIYKVEITKNGNYILYQNGIKTKDEVQLSLKKELILNNRQPIKIDFAIPCIHGKPGETGEIQAFFELMGLPYLGCGPEASQICFNKLTSKLWFDALGIPNTPFTFLTSLNELPKAIDFFKKHKKLFVKASSQGSSVGCYQVFNENEIEKTIKEAFKYSNYVLIEKMVNARELEISAYEFNGKIVTTIPGEIICPSKFYSYEEKYANISNTTTEIIAPNLTKENITLMRQYAEKAFTHLKLRHLSRIDFFLTDENEIFLNEINTFPGMTPISMFPKMMENNGDRFIDFLKQNINNTIN